MDGLWMGRWMEFLAETELSALHTVEKLPEP